MATNNDDLAQKIRLMRNYGFAGIDKVMTLPTGAAVAADFVHNDAEISKGRHILIYDPIVPLINRKVANDFGIGK